MAVAAIDDDVSCIKMWDEQFDEIIHRFARFHHQHDLTWFLQIVYQLLDAVAALDVLSFRFPVDEIINLVGCSIKNCYREPVVLHIENQILAHNRQPDQSHVLFCHSNTPLRVSNKIYTLIDSGL